MFSSYGLLFLFCVPGVVISPPNVTCEPPMLKLASFSQPVASVIKFVVRLR